MPLLRCIYLFFYISFSFELTPLLKSIFLFSYTLGFYSFLILFFGGSGGWA